MAPLSRATRAGVLLSVGLLFIGVLYRFYRPQTHAPRLAVSTKLRFPGRAGQIAAGLAPVRNGTRLHVAFADSNDEYAPALVEPRPESIVSRWDAIQKSALDFVKGRWSNEHDSNFHLQDAAFVSDDCGSVNRYLFGIRAVTDMAKRYPPVRTASEAAVFGTPLDAYQGESFVQHYELDLRDIISNTNSIDDKVINATHISSSRHVGVLTRLAAKSISGSKVINFLTFYRIFDTGGSAHITCNVESIGDYILPEDNSHNNELGFDESCGTCDPTFWKQNVLNPLLGGEVSSTDSQAVKRYDECFRLQCPSPSIYKGRVGVTFSGLKLFDYFSLTYNGGMLFTRSTAKYLFMYIPPEDWSFRYKNLFHMDNELYQEAYERILSDYQLNKVKFADDSSNSFTSRKSWMEENVPESHKTRKTVMIPGPLSFLESLDKPVFVEQLYSPDSSFINILHISYSSDQTSCRVRMTIYSLSLEDAIREHGVDMLNFEHVHTLWKSHVLLDKMVHEGNVYHDASYTTQDGVHVPAYDPFDDKLYWLTHPATAITTDGKTLSFVFLGKLFTVTVMKNPTPVFNSLSTKYWESQRVGSEFKQRYYCTTSPNVEYVLEQEHLPEIFPSATKTKFVRFSADGKNLIVATRRGDIFILRRVAYLKTISRLETEVPHENVAEQQPNKENTFMGRLFKEFTIAMYPFNAWGIMGILLTGMTNGITLDFTDSEEETSHTTTDYDGYEASELDKEYYRYISSKLRNVSDVYFDQRSGVCYPNYHENDDLFCQSSSDFLRLKEEFCIGFLSTAGGFSTIYDANVDFLDAPAGFSRSICKFYTRWELESNWRRDISRKLSGSSRIVDLIPVRGSDLAQGLSEILKNSDAETPVSTNGSSSEAYNYGIFSTFGRLFSYWNNDLKYDTTSSEASRFLIVLYDNSVVNILDLNSENTVSNVYLFLVENSLLVTVLSTIILSFATSELFPGFMTSPLLRFMPMLFMFVMFLSVLSSFSN